MHEIPSCLDPGLLFLQCLLLSAWITNHRPLFVTFLPKSCRVYGSNSRRGCLSGSWYKCHRGGLPRCASANDSSLELKAHISPPLCPEVSQDVSMASDPSKPNTTEKKNLRKRRRARRAPKLQAEALMLSAGYSLFPCTVYQLAWDVPGCELTMIHYQLDWPHDSLWKIAWIAAEQDGSTYRRH